MEGLTETQKTAFLKAFGKRLEELIYGKFESKQKFLRDSGFYKNTLHNIITGDVDPQLTTLYRLSLELGIPLEDLVKSVTEEKAKNKGK
jgi:hypothetical protein